MSMKDFEYAVRSYAGNKLKKSMGAYGGESISIHTQCCREWWGGNRIVVLNLKTAQTVWLSAVDMKGTLNDLFVTRATVNY